MSRILLFISFISLFFSAAAQDVAGLDDFEKSMKPGTVLTYEVKIGKIPYILTATIKALGNEISFSWDASEPANKSGIFQMNAEAVANADALFHVFESGTKTLSNETSLWLSKKIQSEITANTSALLKIQGAEDTATLMSNTISETGFLLNGDFVTVPGWELEGGSDIKYLVGVIESNKFPLIYRLDIGWTMILTEVKTP
ncbi:MAG: hypothetical protein IPP77_04780 [Bacteroidetes bacterium]|nr:hypothetical protein [Bacteroidota bacterium]